MDDSTTARRFLALHALHLSCDRLRLTSGALPDAPFAFVEKQANAVRLVALDRRALASGLEPGLTLADARARIPDLVTLAHDPVADRAFLEALADACDRYTPAVALDPPDGVTLDITGCAHLHGDEEALAADAVARFSSTVALRSALADTPEAAQALARFGGDAVAGLPVAALRLDPDSTAALVRAGLCTVGDLAVRPTAALSARFGKYAADRLARITGTVDSRLVPRRALPAIHCARRFAEPVAHVDHVMAAIADLVAQACTALVERDCGARAWHVHLYRSDGDVRRLTVESGLPTRDAAAVLRLFAERIDTLTDPLDPGFGFDAVRLGLARLEPLRASQLALEGGTLAEDALAALIDRLTTRLGRGRVRRFALADTHIPEQRVLELPAIDPAKPVPWPRPEACEPPLRPIHLFDPPQPIDVIAEVPDGPPHRFRWRRDLHEVLRYEGPERIAAEWWRRRDGAGLTRDYYRVEDTRGRRFWVFRHGLFGVEKANPGWFLHGLFA